ncbi:MAG: TetR/AcrR family transcriptional regulator [Alphaproteobacteria bacterium]|nr:TetR/AcrR family transcriptional regulator [Alphaproteobacteria bacterium]
MAPRRYTSQRRDQAMADTRRRIVEAVVALHGEQGVQRTSYAQIAQRADVAVPTVYKHFPDLVELLGACIGHTTASAPTLTPELYAGLGDTPARIDALVARIFARHQALSPWLHWAQHEAALVPELGQHTRHRHEQDLRFIREALAPRFGTALSKALVALVDILTRYSAWETLTQERGLSQDDAIAATRAALAALLDAAPQTAKTPSRRSQP